MMTKVREKIKLKKDYKREEGKSHRVVVNETKHKHSHLRHKWMKKEIKKRKKRNREG